MRKYEGVFIFKPNLEDEVRNQAFDRIKAAIESNGTITEINEWEIENLLMKLIILKKDTIL